MSLSLEQTERYERDGVLFPLPGLTAEEVAHYRHEFERLLATLGGEPQPDRMRHLHLFHRWAYDLALTPIVLDAIEGVIGADILVHSATMFSKLPSTQAFVSWHQDGFYIGLSAYQYVSAWIALSDSSPDNGCMRVAARSHRDGMFDHDESSRSPDNLLSSGMTVKYEHAERDAVNVVLRPGEFSLHHVSVVHGSNANVSPRPRIGFAVRYVAPSVKQKLNHTPAVLARGTDRFNHFYSIKSPPAMELPAAIRAQEALTQWTREHRDGPTHVPYPIETGIR